MSKSSKLFLILLAFLSLKNIAAAGTSNVSSPTTSSKKLSGMDLLKADENQIALLNQKLEELKAAGGDVTVIQSYIKLAEEMRDLNNKRHELHAAVKGFEKGVEIFSENIKEIIEKVNEILTAQSEVAINNAKVAALLQQPQAAQAATSNEAVRKKRKR